MAPEKSPALLRPSMSLARARTFGSLRGNPPKLPACPTLSNIMASVELFQQSENVVVSEKRARNVFRLDRALTCASLALGSVHAWMGRSSMNPDGISYLDVGDAFVHRNWAVAINGWWSPLYAWVLGVVIDIVKPQPQWEFPLVHAVNFAIFASALFGFRFFLRSLVASTTQFDAPEPHAGLSDSSIQLLGYAIFLWISLEVITVYDVSPDLAVSGCVYLSAGAFLRLRQTSALRHSVLLGFSLGVGYWTKTILLPLGIFSLCVALFWSHEMLWRRRLVQASIVFAFMAAPFVLLLSHEKHRFTFGDSGRVNYAWAMSNAPTRNWQGGPLDAGKPLHPTRVVLTSPPVYEFNGPIIGTYPPWTDPSY